MDSQTKKFPIKPAPASTMVFACATVAALLGFMAYLTVIVDGMGWLFASVFLPIIVVFGVVAFSTRKTCFAVTKKGLEVTGDWAGETVLWRDLDVEKARIVQFATEPGLKPKWKTVGLAMPGYCSGWFRLHDKRKALLFLTSQDEAIYLPTQKDYVVLLSAEDNHGLLQALQDGPAGLTSPRPFA